jgi:hypothetical protein
MQSECNKHSGQKNAYFPTTETWNPVILIFNPLNYWENEVYYLIIKYNLI